MTWATFGVDQYDKKCPCDSRAFCLLAFLFGRAGCLQDPSENAHYEVKYSALYFTWKLLRNCARLLDKLLRI